MKTREHHMTLVDYTCCRMPADALVAAAIKQRFNQEMGPILIAVGGPGGSGKSELSHALVQRMGEAAVFSLDEYKVARDVRRAKGLSGPHPNANQMDLLRCHLERLKAGETVPRPRYNNALGEADGTTPYTPRRFNVIDGEVSTYRHFADLIDFSLFIHADWKTQLLTRITRDTEVRGQSADLAVETFLLSNLREFPEFGLPTRHSADLLLFRHPDNRIGLVAVAEPLVPVLQDILARSQSKVDFHGLVVPLTTPFDAQGNIDETALARHLDFLAERGIGRILVGGTTGEFFALDSAERRRIFILARAQYDATLLFHASGDCLRTTQDNVRWAQDNGADAVLALPPIYPSGLGEDELAAYFQAIAEACQIPLILYNFPRHAGNEVTPGVVRRVPHYGVKDSGDTGDCLGVTPHYYTARDDAIPAYHARGAVGFYSGAANFAPEPFVALERALRDGDQARILACHAEVLRYSPSGPANSIAGVKAALSRALPGYPPHVRPPLLTHET